ncbi:hypothetical protein M885DRAFT_191809 [Pelagophyceae sp. CCMP2097]|nr:hypothetical protein M885DRAFT_191809 [Pelagophyceae sp. CCMP2097]
MPRLFRSISRRATPNLTTPAADDNADDSLVGEARVRLSNVASVSQSMSEKCSIYSSRDHAGGMLEKQKGTLRSWPKRWCWVRDGRFCWAAPEAKNASKDGTVKERGGMLLADILAVERAPTADKPFHFTVRSDERVISFSAESAEAVEAWFDVLAPQPLEMEDDEPLPGDDVSSFLKRFPARLVRTEEVVVTVFHNRALDISKFVGGGFRLRLDELQAPCTEVPMEWEQARALGFPRDVRCVVARGQSAWSADDGGSCVLAFSGAAKQDWQDVCDAAPSGGAAHARLAGWRLAPKSHDLFNFDDYINPAKLMLEDLETWLRLPGQAHLRFSRESDERFRFCTRYSPPPPAMRETAFLVSVHVLSSSDDSSKAPWKVAVPCNGSRTVGELLAEVRKKQAARHAGDFDLSNQSCVFRLSEKRSYLVRLEAPLLSSADVVEALRESVKPIRTVSLILQVCSPDDAAELVHARKRFSNIAQALEFDQPGRNANSVLANSVLAAALRAKPPNLLKLANLLDGQLETILPQLVQALKSSRDNEAPLMRFLLQRALLNPVYVGLTLFWVLRAEMSKGGLVAQVHGALLAAYVGACGVVMRSEYEKQVVLDTQLRSICAGASALEDKQARSQFASRELRRLQRSGELPAGMDLPCMPGKRVGRLKPDACRVLSSKAAPILLIFEAADVGCGGDDKHIAIFKMRDDLRQDAAMLQSMRQMDAFWLAAGHECWLRTYVTMSTDLDVGWIEVIRGAKETAEIQACWGSGAIGGAFQNNVLNAYLVEHNEDQKQYSAAQERFAASCAASCVATYVLGIADRHNGNIMLSSDGRIFHIDFGHVLGNFKKIKGTGIKREKTKLVLTPEMMQLGLTADAPQGARAGESARAVRGVDRVAARGHSEARRRTEK